MTNHHHQFTRNPSASEEEYTHMTAGVREQQGHVPWWLLAVIVGLFIWDGYYLVNYWHPQ